MVKNKQVVIVGGGNVAQALGSRLQQAGFDLTYCLRRGKKAYSWLAASGAHFLPLARLSSTESPHVIIAVADAAIETIAQKLSSSKALVVHTAGSVPVKAVADHCPKAGVLYPLQSLRPQTNHDVTLPLLLEVANDGDKMALQELAEAISPQLFWVNSSDRLLMHVNAVLVSNFTNHLYHLAARQMQDSHLDFAMLLPLIEETATRLRQGPPEQWLTGPAIRHDEATLALHRALLQTNPRLQQLYQMLTNSIQSMGDKP
jgi:predicted short-subunit dehydrogenase-like oxidoreductase (DUF2520 family)